MALITTLAPKSQQQEFSTSTSETTSTSDSTSDSNTIIYYSPDSVVPGSISNNDDSSTVTQQCPSQDLIYQNQDMDVDQGVDVITISDSSSIIETLPGFTQSVNTDLQVSFGHF